VTASAALEGGPVSRAERSFPCLDGARAIAATAVVGTHVSFWAGDQNPELLGRIWSRLEIGVPIFFVLSGFLLSRPLFLAAARGRPTPRTQAYLWRRALRILPAYWVTVTAAFLLLPGNAQVGPEHWIRQFTLTQTYGANLFGEGLSHTWSLCTEVSFYLALPLVGAGLVRLSRRRPERPTPALVAMAVAAVLGWVWLVVYRATDPTPVPMDLWLPTYAGWFGAGMTLAVLSVSDPTWRPVRIAGELGSSLATCWSAAAVLFWLATSSLAGPVGLTDQTAAESLTRNVLYMAVATFVVLPLVFGDQQAGIGRRILGSPPVVFLGEVSYGLFLIHVPVLVGGYALMGWVPFTGNIVLVFALVYLVSLALAAAHYFLVERPVRRWRDLVPADRARNNSGAVTAASAASTST
jgi:peptidoglycan/LPS O-acetylase OafA/YrhL